MTTSILNLFSSSNSGNNETTITNTMNEAFPSLTQGTQFNRYQSTIKRDLEKQAKKVSDGKEGFQTTSTQTTVDDLRKEYNKALQDYNALVNKINLNVNGYVERTSPNNPYLNKHIKFTDGKICYVTSKGVAKPYVNVLDFEATAGKNGCPSTTTVSVGIAWDSKNKPGTVLATTPPLTVGTPMKSGQICGAESVNVFVDKLMTLDTGMASSYMGCYNSNNHLTFIGNKPPQLTDISIQNGSFSQPVLNENSFKSITGTEVPGWYFDNSILIRNSKAWGFPMPYPNGPQCVVIKRKGSIYVTLDLVQDSTYVLTMFACGRSCCTNPSKSNTIQVQIYTNNNAFISQVGTVTPRVNVWKQESVTFKVPTSQRYRLYLKGTANQDNSTAIQAITLTRTPTVQGTYSYDECEYAAKISGYQYFGLQQANSTTGKGFCAVSNSQPEITQFGKASVPSKMIELWSSKTSGQPGNTATLTTTGAIQVINASGAVVYSSPSPTGEDANYIGCYSDKTPSAMKSTSTSLNSANNCKQIAKLGKYKYYGTQNTNSQQLAQCMASNSFSDATKYGVASNCAKVGGTWMGGAQSNAIYSVDNNGSYYLAVQNDGNMVVYRGSSPQDNQGAIWSTNTTGKHKSANPKMVASNGKYGKNWVASGATLAAGDFIGSSDGKLALIMQNDGNLVLYTYEMVENCQKIGSTMAGGEGAAAMYNIGVKGDPQFMGKLAFIDEDSNLFTYTNDNQTFGDTYQVINNANSEGNNIQGASFVGATMETCKQACNKLSDCAGFVLDISNNNTCYPKTKGMYPYGGSLVSAPKNDLFIRSKRPLKPPTGVTTDVISIDTLQYKQYVNSGTVGSEYGLAKATSVEKQQLAQLQTKMDMLSTQITDITNKFQTDSIAAKDQYDKNTASINKNVVTINKMNKKTQDIKAADSNLQNILSDSDIVVLQKNYEYLAWSILAAGTVLVSMNIVKSNNIS